MDLESGIQGSLSRVEKCQQAREPVLRVPDLVKDQQHPGHGEQHEVSDPRARREEHQSAEQGDERRHGEVGLEQDQKGGESQHEDEGKHPFLELPDLLSLLGRKHGTPDHDHDPGDLRRLEVHRTDVDPAPGAVQGR